MLPVVICAATGAAPVRIAAIARASTHASSTACFLLQSLPIARAPTGTDETNRRRVPATRSRYRSFRRPRRRPTGGHGHSQAQRPTGSHSRRWSQWVCYSPGFQLSRWPVGRSAAKPTPNCMQSLACETVPHPQSRAATEGSVCKRTPESVGRCRCFGWRYNVSSSDTRGATISGWPPRSPANSLDLSRTPCPGPPPVPSSPGPGPAAGGIGKVGLFSSIEWSFGSGNKDNEAGQRVRGPAVTSRRLMKKPASKGVRIRQKAEISPFRLRFSAAC